MIAKLTTYSKIFADVGWQSGQRGVVGVYVCAAARTARPPHKPFKTRNIDSNLSPWRPMGSQYIKSLSP
ncbi:MAG: hypothetical protein FWH20_09580 [Oscillospiraceae bacterium]|nr:hypothetical protein [Oscillospiraceae bacterium]